MAYFTCFKRQYGARFNKEDLINFAALKKLNQTKIFKKCIRKKL